MANNAITFFMIKICFKCKCGGNAQTPNWNNLLQIGVEARSVNRPQTNIRFFSLFWNQIKEKIETLTTYQNHTQFVSEVT
jgi:hypothetical protein